MAGFITTRPGPAIRLVRGSGFLVTTGQVTYILPYDDGMKVSVSQKFIKPIEKLYDTLKEGIKDAISLGSFAASATKTSKTILDIFGVKIFNKDFHAQAWEGSEPAEFSLDLKFYKGLLGEYKAQTEVFNPVKELYGYTLPYTKAQDIFMLPPAPSSIQVFSDYALRAAEGILTLGGTLGNFDKKDVDNVRAGTWSLSYGYHDGSTFTPYMVFEKLIVASSSITTSKQVEKDGNAVFPVSATVNLSMKSQSILIQGDLQ